ncbi:hypothetical protein [Weissella soli]
MNVATAALFNITMRHQHSLKTNVTKSNNQQLIVVLNNADRS